MDTTSAKRSPVLRRVATFLAALALLAACSGGGQTGQSAGGGGSATGGGGESAAEGGGGERENTLIIADNEPPQTFDPIQATNSTVDEVVIPAYDTLVDYDANNELGNRLAESYEVSEDGLSIDVTLREATFHDGSPVTSEDVAYTLDRIKELGVGVASELASYDSTEVTDDRTFTIRLSAPFAPFVPALSRVYILNSELVEQNRGQDFGQTWLASNDAGSGPYQLEEYVTNQQATFSRYEDYWGGFEGQAEQVVFRYLPEAATQRDALQRGEVDVAMDIATTDLQALESSDAVEIDRADTLVQLYIFFNTQKGATADPRVREAVRLAYDYQAHVDQILAGNGSVAEGPLPAAMECHADIPPSEQDLERARALLEEAGQSDLSLTMTYLPVIEEHDRAGTLLQSALREIGVDLQLQGVTFPAYVDLIANVETTPDLGMIYAFPVYPDPNAVLFINFHSQFIGGGYNYAAYANPEVDALVQEAQQLTDLEERCPLYEQAQEIVEGDAVTVNIATPQAVAVHRAGLEGFGYRPAHHNTVDVYSISVGG
jgi:peptide/nickel transport system substrate-binding protein